MRPHLERIRLAWTHCFLVRVLKPGNGLVGSLTRFPPGGSLLFHSTLQASFTLKSGVKVLQNGLRDLSLSDTGAVLRTVLSGVSSFSVVIRLNIFWVASSLRRCGGAIEAITGSHSVGVGMRAPEIVRRVEFSCTSSLLVWAHRAHTGAQYSAGL